MPLLVPDSFPPTLRDRVRWVGYALFLGCCAAFLLWYAPRVAEPDWTPSTQRLRYLKDLSPFWRGAHVAIFGSWMGAIALLAFWKSVRPYTPDRSRPVRYDP